MSGTVIAQLHDRLVTLTDRHTTALSGDEGVAALLDAEARGVEWAVKALIGYERDHPEPALLPDGPALVYVSDDGVVYQLDRMDSMENPLVEDDRMPLRDRRILLALWETYLPTWRMR